MSESNNHEQTHETESDGFFEVERRKLLQAAGLAVGSVALSGATVSGTARAATSTTNSENRYYVGNAVPDNDPEALKNAFFYATSDGENVEKGEILHHEGGKWKSFRGADVTWDIQSMMNAAAANGESLSADEAFENAISAADPGDTILFRDGTYTFDEAHTIRKTLTIKGTGDATIINNNDSEGPLGPSGVISFAGPGPTDTVTNFRSDIEPGDRRIEVEDSTGFEPEDTVMLLEKEYSVLVETHIQYGRIQKVDRQNDVIWLHGSTYRKFRKEWVGEVYDNDKHRGEIRVVEMLDRPRIENLTVKTAERLIDEDRGEGKMDAPTADPHLHMYWCKQCAYDRVRVVHGGNPSLLVRNCWRVHYDNCEAHGAEGVAPDEGEHFYISRSGDVYIESPRIYYARRAIDILEGSYNVEIQDPVIQGFTLYGICDHGPTPTGPVTIRGGKIIAQDFENTPQAEQGDCINLGGDSLHTITDCTLVASQSGLEVIDDNWLLKDVEIRPAARTLPTASTYGVEIVDAENVKLDGVRVRDPNGRFGQSVLIQSSSKRMRNISLDVDIVAAKGDQDHLVEVVTNGGATSSIEDLTIEGRAVGFGERQKYSFKNLLQSSSVETKEFPEAIQLEASEPDAQWTFEFDVDEDGTYELDMEALKAGSYGIYELFIDGQSVETVDFYGDGRTHVIVSEVTLEEGKHTITFKNRGKNDESGNYKMALYYLDVIESSVENLTGLELRPNDAPIKNVDVSMDIVNVGSHGVSVSDSGLVDFSMTGSRIESAKNALDVNGEAANATKHKNWKFRDVSVRAGANGFDFNSRFIDGVWILDCDIETGEDAIAEDGGIQNFVRYAGNRPNQEEPF